MAPETQLRVERRHALVAEIRALEKCIVDLRRRQGFLVGLLAGNIALNLLYRFV